MKKKIWFPLLLSLLFSVQLSAIEIPASDKNISYIGRVEKTDGGAVKFDWVGVYLRFRFTGNSLAITASDTKSNYYKLYIDNKFIKDINIKGEEKLIPLATDLEAGVHSVMLYKRTEAGEGTTTIKSFTLENDAKILAWLDAPKRRLEFIGNSITCGFGSETTNPDEQYTAETEDAQHSYASVTANWFNADYTLIAHSGQGVVRNYGDTNRLSDYTMRQRFFCTFDQSPHLKWDFTQWQPDGVVINLGTNDYSTQPFPTDKEFMNGYKDIINSVRKVYGNVPIFCLSSPMSNDIQRNCIEKVVAESKDSNLYFVPMFKYVLNYPADYGAGHPNAKGQQKLAMLLAPYISSVMGWAIEPDRMKF